MEMDLPTWMVTVTTTMPTSILLPPNFGTMVSIKIAMAMMIMTKMAMEKLPQDMVEPIVMIQNLC